MDSEYQHNYYNYIIINMETVSDKEYYRAYRKIYYYQNRETILEKQKIHYTNNKDKLFEYGKKYYYQNREMILEKNRKYHNENRERINAQKNIWKKELIICECGEMVRRDNQKHKNTKKHLNKLIK